MKYLLILLSAFVYAVEIEPALINGEVVPEGALPQIVFIQSGSYGCSSTIVGPRVLLTAAHCLPKNGATVTFKLNGVSYSGVGTRHPSYPKKDVDLAAVKLSKEVPSDITPIHVSEDQMQVGNEVTLTGFGCVSEGGALDGKLRYGTSTIYGRTGYDLVTQKLGYSLLCSGDSGSSVLYDGQLVAVNSKTNYVSKSYVHEVYKTRSWLKTWAQSNGVDVCGISEGC